MLINILVLFHRIFYNLLTHNNAFSQLIMNLKSYDSQLVYYFAIQLQFVFLFFISISAEI